MGLYRLRPPPGVAVRALLTLAGLTLFPASARGQAAACEDGVIARLEVVNHSIFAPYDLEDRRNAWAYRLVNRAHIRTRESFIRRQILVEEGQCYEPLRVKESARVLRALSFMAREYRRVDHLLPVP